MNFLGSLLSVSHSLFFGVASLFGIGFVIGFHELGHFLFCKLFKVRTPSFSIGFGPRLVTKKMWDTEFSLSAIPLGGYVEIAGASEVGQGEQKEATRNDEHAFTSKRWYQQFLIMIAGIAFNLSFAYAACIILFMVGMPASMILYPKNARPVIEALRKDSVAEKAGLLAGDKLITFNGTPIDQNIPDLITQIQSMPGKEVSLKIERNGDVKKIDLTLDSREYLGRTVGTTGIIFQPAPLPGYGLVESVKEGVALTNMLIYNTAMSIKHIFAKGDTSVISSPIMIISETAKGAQQGFTTFLLFLAYISISLAVLNLLPLPILDGGQILFYTIEAIAGRQIPVKVREYIHIACWLGFLVLVVYLSFKDIKTLLTPYLGKFFGA